MKLLQRYKEWRKRQVPPDKPAGSAPLFFPRVSSGVKVNSDTVLTVSAVWAAVGVISDTVAGFPWHVFRRLSDGSKRINKGGVLDRLLHIAPNPDMTAFTFRQVMTSHRLLWGNAYAEIERSRAGEPVALWPLPPDRVEVVRENGGLTYLVRTDDGSVFRVPGRDVLHLRGLGFDGRVGYSVISFARESFGLSLATERVGAAVFGNGLRPGGQIELAGSLTPEARKQLRYEIERRHRGPDNAGTVMILEKGVQFKATMMPPEDAQWIESRKFQVTEVARWFRVPPHKIADLERATFSNIAEQNQEFVESGILPVVLGWEQEVNIKLLADAALFSKMNMNGLLRGNPKDTAERYRTLMNIGVMSVNEVRVLEDMDPIGPDGDKYFMPLNMTTLARIGEEPAKVLTLPVVNDGDDSDDSDDGDDSKQDGDVKIKRAMRAVFADASARVINKDCKAIKSQLRRFDDTAKLDAWLGVYFGENRDAIASQISLPIRALAESAGCAPQSVWVESVVEQMTARHIARSHTELVAAFDDGNVDALLEEWQVKQVSVFAEQLTESAMVAVMLERSNGKQDNDGDARRIQGG